MKKNNNKRKHCERINLFEVPEKGKGFLRKK